MKTNSQDKQNDTTAELRSTLNLTSSLQEKSHWDEQFDSQVNDSTTSGVITESMVRHKEKLRKPLSSLEAATLLNSNR